MSYSNIKNAQPHATTQNELLLQSFNHTFIKYGY